MSRSFFDLQMNVRMWLVMTGVVIIWLLGWSIAGLPDGRLRVWFLDIGQGDAILMRLPAGEWVLVDGGPDGKVLDLMGRVMPFYERRVELVINSHPHADHLNGLVEVLARYEVDNLWITGVKYNYAGYQKMLEEAAEGGTRVIYTSAKDGSIGKVGFDLIYPLRSLQGEGMENVNNSSIVFRLIYAGRRIFFSGDLEEQKEAELVRADGLNLEADILKAGHHGSKTSNTEDFVRRIGPDYAVISCGVENKFKHPFPGTLERFGRLGLTVYRTDLDGTVEVEVGEELKITSS